jgi:TRAP-type C4-dicarboxylate transport system substrate-binding protein
MIKSLARCALFLLALLPATSVAEPIKLKLSFFTSDGSQVYLHAIKPFVDAVNAEGKGLLEIEVFFSGALGRLQAEQPQLVLDGVADIAFVVPGQTPDLFQDTAVIELPGQFRDAREATLTYTRLLAAHALKGYEDFFVIGSFSANPNSIHSRKPIASIVDLKGQRLRINNLREAAALEKLGAVPVLLSIIQTPEAISKGTIDGATLPPSALLDFGIARATSNHYLLRTSAAPLALLMNRKKFGSLPEQARTLIRKYSGEWPAKYYIENIERLDAQELKRIQSDPKRTVVFPSQSDLNTAQAAFEVANEEWQARNPRNRELLTAVKAEIAKLRSTR